MNTQQKVPEVKAYGKMELYLALKENDLVTVTYQSFMQYCYRAIFSKKEARRLRREKILQPRHVKVILEELVGL